jgi:hypothetical protein
LALLSSFGSFYLFLYLRQRPAVPLLIFGAALKTWALVLSVALWLQGRLDRKNLVWFGVGNGVVAGLFWVHIVREVRTRQAS